MQICPVFNFKNPKFSNGHCNLARNLKILLLIDIVMTILEAQGFQLFKLCLCKTCPMNILLKLPLFEHDTPH